MSNPQSWSRGSRRQLDEVGWSQKVMEMGQGTDKDENGKKGGRTMTKSLICIGVTKLGLLSFLISRANAPFPLCLVRLVILKLSLKLASTGYLHSTSIPILAIYSSVSFIGEGHLLAELPCFSLSSLDSLQLTRLALPPYYPPSYIQSIHSPRLISPM